MKLVKLLVKLEVRAHCLLQRLHVQLANAGDP